LEDRFQAFLAAHRIPPPAANVEILGHEVDALWAQAKLIVELDGFAYHRHRAAFERDRARDADRLLSGYRTIRVTDRRLSNEAAELAAQLRALLGAPPPTATI
jgi:very-short-patch-repair endonuclease